MVNTLRTLINKAQKYDTPLSLDASYYEEETLLDKLKIDDVFYCTHDDNDLCTCRKPAPGLLIQAS
jgi:histidinol phosphatase-like enzyme